MESNRQILEEFALGTFLNTSGPADSILFPLFHADLRSLNRLSRTNYGIHRLFTKGHLRQAFWEPMAAHLAHIIINDPSENNIVELKKILTTYPELLLQKIKNMIIQQTDQVIVNYSLLQLAFSVGDIGMCRVLKPFFELALGKESAQEEIFKQLNEKFGEEKKHQEEYNLEIKNQFAKQLVEVIEAFSNERFNLGKDDHERLILSDETLLAIKTFRDTFVASQKKFINKGMVFRFNTLRELYFSYRDATREWGWSQGRDKCILFEDAIITTVLLWTPTNIAMALCQGLRKVMNSSFNRSLMTASGDHFYTFLQTESPDFYLQGANIDISRGVIAFVIKMETEHGMIGCRRSVDGGERFCKDIEIYLQNQLKALDEFIQGLNIQNSLRQ